MIIPSRYATPSRHNLGRWIERMRGIYNGTIKSDSLTEQRIYALESIGMVWKLEYRSSWNEWLQRVQAYLQTHGDINVPMDYNPDGYHLGFWINEQRKHQACGSLDKDKEAVLNSLGMVWHQYSRRSRQDWLNDAAAYFSEFGDLLVPVNLTYNGEKLGLWLSLQRTRTRTPEQQAELDAIDPSWRVSSRASKAKSQAKGNTICHIKDR